MVFKQQWTSPSDWKVSKRPTQHLSYSTVVLQVSRRLTECNSNGLRSSVKDKRRAKNQSCTERQQLPVQTSPLIKESFAWGARET
eukprot:3139667-Amphidinium_carterae.2